MFYNEVNLNKEIAINYFLNKLYNKKYIINLIL